jgi:glycine hydroxymethyltransferase
MAEGERELNNILNLTRGHSHYMANRLDLVASNSYTSHFSRLVMGSILPNSYCIGSPGARFYGGCTYIDMIEREVYALAKKVFDNPKHVVAQFLSGMQANTAAYNAMLKPNDTVISATIQHGGHYSHQFGGPLRLFCSRVVPLPFDHATYNVDLNKLEDVVKQEKPRLMVLGWSEFLFPHPLQKVREICNRHHVKLMYDMSHVIGLIAGGLFQPEAIALSDIVTSSTGKTLHAPDHGIVLFNDDTLKAGIWEGVKPLLTSNTHPQELAALGIALAEMLHAPLW